ncbi:hypothetical protein OUZ56_003086 [Daphnia magna]|uniref:Uncharacterized protein n=1 Tax=Daphnia magna TaxID=35525 RepID=A0ABR0A7P8_9CRUS|nr:hypothetical protein OUZ56_003086 [Daphnia magna]
MAKLRRHFWAIGRDTYRPDDAYRQLTEWTLTAVKNLYLRNKFDIRTEQVVPRDHRAWEGFLALVIFDRFLPKRDNPEIFYYSEEYLRSDEIDQVTIPRFWLWSGHINAAQTMLRRQFPEIGGLMSVEYCGDGNYPVPQEEKWIHMNFVEEGRQQALACMSSLVRTKDSRMEYELSQCQRMQDENTGDCGVLCIAFAVSIANGRDPTTLKDVQPGVQTSEAFLCIAFAAEFIGSINKNGISFNVTNAMNGFTALDDTYGPYGRLNACLMFGYLGFSAMLIFYIYIRPERTNTAGRNSALATQHPILVYKVHASTPHFIFTQWP